MQERPIRVFFNTSAVPERPAGAGRYAIELGKALARQPGIEVIEPVIGSRWAGKARPAWEQIALRGELIRVAPDVYHGPHMYTPRTDVPTVATVHDLTFVRLPGRYSFTRRAYYRYLARTASRAQRIIVPSAWVASDVVRFLRYQPARVRVIAEAPRAGLAPASAEAVVRFREGAGLARPYLLCLGTAEPGKRAIDAIRAMPAILASHPEALLVLAGNAGSLSEALHREVKARGLADNVHFPGYVPDDELPALLTGATALLFPSRYEGFGLPPLEAMACGTPVICSEVPAMSDVLKGGVTFVPVGDRDAIAHEAVRLLGEPALRADRGAHGKEFVRRFSWEAAAAETASVYREVVS